MAYASLLSLTQTLEPIIRSHDQCRLCLHEEHLQLRSIHGKLSNLLLFLEDSSQKINRETASSLEGRIRDAAYEAEDLYESHMESKSVASYEAEDLFESHIAFARRSACCFQGVTSRYRKIIDVLQRCAKCFASTTTSQTIDESLQNVIEKLSSISEDVDKMKANNNGDEPLHPLESNATIEMEGVEEVVKVHPRISSGGSSSEPTSSDKSSMVGFKNDMFQIKDILTRSPSKLEIISLVGMGGIGKTTLATNIYNDSLVNHHFDIRAWITVSQEYDVVALLAGLLRSTGSAPIQMNGKDEAELKMKLYQNLKQRRYLIVMDDVWDDVVLEKFRNIFPDDNNGSRIIMTSRSSKVGGSSNSCNYIHHLSFLGRAESWTLLCQKAFGEEMCPPELEDIGKRIAENCNGLALSLVAIGGVLHKAEKTLAHWEYVERNMKFVETGNYERSMEILSWSYNQLPHHLRACFLYMGVFREDLVVHVSHLIMLWIANGFIKPVSSKMLEEVAIEYLKDLIDRNLIMIRKRGYCKGEIKTCFVHDLTRKMCIKKAQEELFLLPDRLLQTSPVSLKGYRHLSISFRDINLSELADVSTVRSIRCFKHEMPKIISFQCLKVFDGCQIIFQRFPIELVQLVNLRFIALLCKGIGEIPASLSILCCLQTLLIFRYISDRKYIIIPLEILKMPQLMHLWVQGGVLGDCSGGRMENLQTLRGITNFRFTKETLAIFPNLKTLEVTYSEKFAFGSCFENMVHLCQLEHLKIHNFRLSSVFESSGDLAFPVKMRKLSLYNVYLSRRQLSTIGKLPNLEVLKLKSVRLSGRRWQTNEGEFGELKFLFMEIPREFSWNLEGIHFPSLECLAFKGFENCLPSEIGEIPNLKVINLYDCSSSTVGSANKIREALEEWGNDALQINVYPRYCLVGGGFRSYMLYDLQLT